MVLVNEKKVYSGKFIHEKPKETWNMTRHIWTERKWYVQNGGYVFLTSKT